MMTWLLAASGLGVVLLLARKWKHSIDPLRASLRVCRETLSASEQRLRDLQEDHLRHIAILSALVESVIAVDHRGHIVFLNPAAERLFGVRASDVQGRSFLEMVRQGPLNEVVSQTLQTRTPVAREITLHAPTERTLAVHARQVAYGSEPAGVLAALHDITELRKLERLRQEFVANVTHELKTPLTAIQGFVETLLEGALEDPAHNREFLEAARDQAERLSRLIDDVLDLSAIEAKRVEYRFEPVSLAAVTDRLLKGLAPLAQAKKVAFANHLTESLPRVKADREKLAQILMNLLDNAIKFSKPGGMVALSAEASGDRMTIRVRDGGIGIPENDLPRIFERFYRVDKARSREMGGTGLGLSIVKHLVEAQGGTVQVQSRPDEGSLFSFTLPLIETG